MADKQTRRHVADSPWSRWLDERIGARGLRDVERDSGIGASLLSTYISRAVIPTEWTRPRLAAYLQVDLAELNRAIASHQIAEIRASVESNVVPGRSLPSARSVDELPVYAWGTAGDPTGDDLPEPSDYVRPADEVGPLSRRAFGVRVRGGSMVGEDIHDGDLVWVEPGDCRPPCVVLARIEGMDGDDSGMVVKLHKRDGFLYSHAEDGETIVACKAFTIIGPVVGSQRARRMAWGR
jgi:SOS-response transcriptional repressor LexA